MAALLALAGCGVVKDAAVRALSKAFGQTVGDVLGSEEPAPGVADDGSGGFTIAADESVTDDIAPEDHASDEPGFYKIVEPNGTVRFVSNLAQVPVSQRDAAQRLAMAPSRVDESRAAPPRKDRARQLASAESAPPAARAPSSTKDVVIYTTSWCGWCRKTRQWLDAKGVSYVNKDIEDDPDAGAEMRELTGGDSGIPVVVIDGEVIQGYNERKMASLLN
jgi:glutaredoxin